MHSIKGGMTNCQKEMKRAVDCGYWNMFRFNPALKAEGKNPFTLDSKAPTADYKEFIMGEARYSSLTRSFQKEQRSSSTKLPRTPVLDTSIWYVWVSCTQQNNFLKIVS